MLKVVPVILCGGSGTRLWPLSRHNFPKQFMCLTGNDSFFQQAAKRSVVLCSDEFQVAQPLIVTGEEHRFLVLQQINEVNIESGAILLEPGCRNTAPALTIAALCALEKGNDPILVVTPADHVVSDGLSFTKAIQSAIHEAANGTVVIFGVFPEKPKTGYGYIQISQTDENSELMPVRRFVEKPNEDVAKSYLKEGGYFWNAGIFVMRASVWKDMLEQFRPDILATTQSAWSKKTLDALFIRFEESEYSAIPSESIDRAVIEHCHKFEKPMKMIPLDAGWTDLGAWDDVWNVQPKDDFGNANSGDVLLTDCKNTLAYASTRLVALLGIEDVIVIETEDAVMIADKSRSQDIKGLTTQLQNLKRQEILFHLKVYRPWGWYQTVEEGCAFKVKHIYVNPKASLSLQKHRHRTEHWIVVSGTAKVIKGDEVLILTQNQSISILIGEVHRLINPETIPLEIIEVQTGVYLGEDDIIRFEDNYGRKKN